MNRYEIIQRLQGLDVAAARKLLSEDRSHPVKERLRSIVEYHAHHNPLYKEKLESSKYTRFEELPIMHKSDFQKPLETIISDEYSVKDLYIGNTSGSSGNPFFYAKNKESHAAVHAIIEELYSQHGLSVCNKQARFYGIPSSGKSHYIELIKDFLLNRTRFPIYDLSDKAMEKFVNKFRRNKFVYVYGYTSAILLFSKYLIKKDMTLKQICPTIKKCVVTSEVCTKEDRNLIQKAMGVGVLNEYGCSEAGMIAFDDIDGVWRLVEEDSYFEVVDANGNVVKEGQEGKLLITCLSNKAMPFIRYEVGDMAIISHDEKGPYLKELSGRVSDIIKLPSGKVAGGLTFYYISRAILETEPFIKEFIVRQTKIDTFEFDIVSEQSLSKEVEYLLQKEMDRYLESGLKIKLNQVDCINRPSSGKIKHFYSEL